VNGEEVGRETSHQSGIERKVRCAKSDLGGVSRIYKLF